jgi:hypothetical protein
MGTWIIFECFSFGATSRDLILRLLPQLAFLSIIFVNGQPRGPAIVA